MNASPLKKTLDSLLGLAPVSPYRTLEKRIGYRFKNSDLLEQALTHPSHRFESRGGFDNQRLEFLGDAVLSLVTAAHLYHQHGDRDEGGLTEWRSRLTSGKALARFARQIDVGSFLKLGRGEEKTGGRQRDTVLADALEAIVGAAYLDGGLKAADKIVTRVILPELPGHQEPVSANPKGALQEIIQRRDGVNPRYSVIEEAGPLHSRHFTVEVTWEPGRTARGSASSKRQAEALAAAAALRQIRSAASAPEHSGG